MYRKYTNKITIYGSDKDVNEAEKVLNTLSLTNKEFDDRLIIQDAIDKHNIKASILYDGNNVYSFNKIIRDFKHALNSKPCKMHEGCSGDWDMTDALYHFFTLACGSIAHYNKYGWIGEYPTKEDLKRFCKDNESGKSILQYQPHWASDRQRIAKEILNIIA